MNKTLIPWLLQSLLPVVVFIAMLPAAEAVTFTDSVKFTGESFTSPSSSYTYATVADNSGFIWMHDILNDLGGNALSDVQLIDAILSLTYAKTEGNENWSLPGLGALEATADPPRTTQFPLDASWLQDLNGDGAIFLSLSESSTGRDTLRLIESKLSGNYQLKQVETPDPEPELPSESPHSPHQETPEPGTLFLLTAGLGLGFSLGKKRRGLSLKGS